MIKKTTILLCTSLLTVNITHASPTKFPHGIADGTSVENTDGSQTGIISPGGKGGLATLDGNSLVLGDQIATPSTSRSPTGNDDSAHGYTTGSFWGYNKKFWRLDYPEPGYAGWTDITSSKLPGDIVGVHLNTINVVSGGSGHSVGDIINIGNGGYIKVTKVDSSGAITGINGYVNTWKACPTSDTITQVSSSGSGTGATFKATFSYPTLQGTRKMSSCYSGPALEITRSSDGAKKDIGFLADGSLDTGTLDAFVGSDYAYVTRWYDQGGGNDLDTSPSNPSNVAPTIYPAGMIGNSRSVMFNGQALTQMSESPNSQTWLKYGGRFSVPFSNHTVAVLGNAVTVRQNFVGLLLIGRPYYDSENITLNQQKYALDANYTAGIDAILGTGGDTVRQDATLMIGTTNGSHQTLYKDGTTYNRTLSYVHSGNTPGYGALGLGGANNSGGVAEDAVVVVPWALDATEQSDLAASMYQTYGIQPQGQNIISFLGHSLVAGTGSQYQQTWTNVFGKLKNRPDIHRVNYGRFGDTCKNQMSAWDTLVSPTAKKYNGQKTFFMMCGDNDVYVGLSAQQVVDLYSDFVTKSHALGGVAICGIPAYSNEPDRLQYVQDIAKGITSGIGCDVIYDERVVPDFSNPKGPFNGPLYYTDGVHKSNLGQSVEANLFKEKSNTVINQQ